MTTGSSVASRPLFSPEPVDAEPLPLGCQRDLFSLPSHIAYFNGAFLAPLMRPVEEAAIRALFRLRDPSRLGATDFFREADRVRALFAQLVGCDRPERIAVVPSVSYGLAVAARNVQLAPGQSVVVCEGQFPSNVHVWRRLCAARSGTLRRVPLPEGLGRRADRWTENVIEAIDSTTAAVAVGSVDWSDGTLLDLEAIGRRARQVGAAFIVDGIQSVGVVPFDVRRVQPDALVCASYKWLHGPMGVGLAYFSSRFDGGEPLEETWLGRSDSDDLSRLDVSEGDYRAGAARYDMGGRAQFVLLPMLAAALEQLLAWEPARIGRYCVGLLAPLVHQAERLGFRAAHPSQRSPHLFALHPPAGTDLGRLCAALADASIIVSNRRGAIRVSAHLYNDEQDVGRLVAALGSLPLGAGMS
jgi:selenocysteine lyase/cysteine desulfurase